MMRAELLNISGESSPKAQAGLVRDEEGAEGKGGCRGGGGRGSHSADEELLPAA